MKRSGIKRVLSVVLTAALLCGCGENPVLPQESQKPVEAGEISTGELEVLEIIQNGPIDNTLDAYTAVARGYLGVQTDSLTGKQGVLGANSVVIGSTRGSFFAKHFYDVPEKCWDELVVATDSGEKEKIRLAFPNPAMCVGPVWGSDHYMMSRLDITENKFLPVLFETDEQLEILREIPVEAFPNSRDRFAYVLAIKVDASGNLHLISNLQEENSELNEIYSILDPEGNVLFEYMEEAHILTRLRFAPDGRVLLETLAGWERENHVLYEWNRTEGRLEVLTEIPVTEENRGGAHTLTGDGRILSAENTGIYAAGMDGSDRELLYDFGRHGIQTNDIRDLRENPDGSIQMVYYGSGGPNYIALQKTLEQKDILTLTFAVSPLRKETYQSAVQTFNKNHPAFFIELKEDYDEKRLLTELIAGNGPVLVDTSLTGFGEHADLWMPMDGLFERLGVAEELIPGTMKIGEIGGRLYGVVPDFWIDTVVAEDVDTENWDYEAFLKLIRERPVRAVFNYNPGDKGGSLFLTFFGRGLQDCYFLKEDPKGISFDREAFLELLELADRYYDGGGVTPETGGLWPQGDVLCHLVTIWKPEDLELYRAFYGGETPFAGYPSGEGGLHFLGSYNPLTVRSTASSQEKAAAVTFLKYLLSQDVQAEASKSIHFALSVRKDVLEQQLDSIHEGMVVFHYGYPTLKLGEDIDIQSDARELYALIEDATAGRYLPNELGEILRGELALYFERQISKEILVDHLESRIGLYLSENQ